jgi:smad nuclear-interacting protein 1
LSGLLAGVTNMKNGTVLKYHEPPEAKRCKGWRIFVYKNGSELDNFGLDSESSFLVGRDRNVSPHVVSPMFFRCVLPWTVLIFLGG